MRVGSDAAPNPVATRHGTSATIQRFAISQLSNDQMPLTCRDHVDVDHRQLAVAVRLRYEDASRGGIVRRTLQHRGLTERQREWPHGVRLHVPGLLPAGPDCGQIVGVVRPYVVPIWIRMRALVAVGRIEAPFVDAAVRRQAGPFGTVGPRTITERAETVPAEEEHAPGAHREHDPGDLARPVEELIRL